MKVSNAHKNKHFLTIEEAENSIEDWLKKNKDYMGEKNFTILPYYSDE